MPMMYQMYESQYEDLRGTVYGPDSPDFFPVQASETLRKALSGLDTKDQVIINTILYHNNFQRQKILNAYEDMYSRVCLHSENKGKFQLAMYILLAKRYKYLQKFIYTFKNLVDDLEEETGGYFLEMAQALFKPAPQYDTTNLHRSISNRYGDRSVAIEISCTRSARQLRVIRETYQNEYKKTIEKDLGVKVEGIVGRMLALLLCKPRDEEGKRVDQDLVDTHAQTLIKNPIEEIAKNLTQFEQIFVGNSWKHIAAVLDKVDEIRSTEKDIETIIRKNKFLHSEIRQILLTIIRVSRNMQLYFAEKLRTAMTGDRPDHPTIIRIAVSRSEIDLFDIAEEYKRKYHRSLDHDIQQTCSGDYMRLVSSMLAGGTNNNNNNNNVFS
uniref:Annexin n=1 Tax=Heterorhabditis bacteriophora TaxID=37862 RepID=A0A1I7XPA8_HETBA